MPYVVNKAFRACGRRLCQGEIVDACKWKTKNSLLSLGWISYVKPEKTKNTEDSSVTERAKPLKKIKTEHCTLKGDDNNDI